MFTLNNIKKFGSVAAVAVALLFVAGCASFHAQLYREASLPHTYTAYGSPYTVTKYEVKTDSRGRVLVTLTGKGLNAVQDGYGRLQVGCAVVVTGGDVNYRDVTIAPGGNGDSSTVTYHFGVKTKPYAILVYPADNPMQKAKFTCQ